MDALTAAVLSVILGSSDIVEGTGSVVVVICRTTVVVRSTSWTVA